MQFPGRAQGADQIVTPLHDDPGNALQPVRVPQELIGLKRGLMGEVMTLDAGQGQGEVGAGEMVLDVGIGQEGGGATLPHRPGLGGGESGDLIVAGETAVVGAHQVAAFRDGDGGEEVAPIVGKDPTGTLLIEPGDLRRSTEKDTAQDQGANPLRVGLGIGQGQG